MHGRGREHFVECRLRVQAVVPPPLSKVLARRGRGGEQHRAMLAPSRPSRYSTHVDRTYGGGGWTLGHRASSAELRGVKEAAARKNEEGP
eukprot:scaffold309911_cov28-Tisochrysis_lutea.AAC.5